MEQANKVAATIDAAYQLEMARKKALLQTFLAEGMSPPAPEKAEPTPTGDVAPPAPVDAAADGEMSDQEAVDLAKRQLALTQADSRLGGETNTRTQSSSPTARCWTRVS